MAIKTTMN